MILRGLPAIPGRMDERDALEVAASHPSQLQWELARMFELTAMLFDGPIDEQEESAGSCGRLIPEMS